MMALAPAGSAWGASADGLTLRLEPLDWPGCGAAAALEMWGHDAYWVGAADWSLREERHHAAAVFAEGDVGLERAARRALHRAAMALRLVLLDEEFLEQVERLEEDPSVQEEPALLVEGLDPEARAIVVRTARNCGGRVRRRRRRA